MRFQAKDVPAYLSMFQEAMFLEAGLSMLDAERLNEPELFKAGQRVMLMLVGASNAYKYALLGTFELIEYSKASDLQKWYVYLNVNNTNTSHNQ